MPVPPEPAQSPREARHVAAVALFVVFLDMVGLGMIIPVLPRLVGDIGHVGLDGAAAAGGWLFAVFSLVQFLCAPFMGTLADHIGRRPLLLLAIGGLAVAASACVVLLPGQRNLSCFFWSCTPSKGSSIRC